MASPELDRQAVGNVRWSIVTVELLVTVVVPFLTVVVVVGTMIGSAVLFNVRFADSHMMRQYVPV